MLYEQIILGPLRIAFRSDGYDIICSLVKINSFSHPGFYMPFLYSTARSKGSKMSSAFNPLKLGVRTCAKYWIYIKRVVPGKCCFLFLLTFWIIC